MNHHNKFFEKGVVYKNYLDNLKELINSPYKWIGFVILLGRRLSQVFRN